MIHKENFNLKASIKYDEMFFIDSFNIWECLLNMHNLCLYSFPLYFRVEYFECFVFVEKFQILSRASN